MAYYATSSARNLANYARIPILCSSFPKLCLKKIDVLYRRAITTPNYVFKRTVVVWWLPGGYAVTTRCLRGGYAVATRWLRSGYAEATQWLRGRLRGGYAVATRSATRWPRNGYAVGYAVATQWLRGRLRSGYAVGYAVAPRSATRWLRGGYAVATRWLRGVYAVGTRWLRGGYAVATRRLRSGYAVGYAVATQWLRGRLRGGHAMATRSATRWLRSGYAVGYAVATRSATQWLRGRLRGGYSRTYYLHLIHFCRKYTTFTKFHDFMVQKVLKCVNYFVAVIVCKIMLFCANYAKNYVSIIRLGLHARHQLMTRDTCPLSPGLLTCLPARVLRVVRAPLLRSQVLVGRPTSALVEVFVVRVAMEEVGSLPLRHALIP